MSVLETVFWFAAVPLLIALTVGGLAYAGGRPRSGFGKADTGGKRYRPGRPYDAAPVWFLSAPEKADEVAVAARAERPALAGGRHAAPQGSTGGASDRW